MLTFRTYLTKNDPDAICKIAASTGFFDESDVELNRKLAEKALRNKDCGYEYIIADSAVNRWLMSVLANFPMPGKGRLKFSGFQH